MSVNDFVHIKFMVFRCAAAAIRDSIGVLKIIPITSNLEKQETGNQPTIIFVQLTGDNFFIQTQSLCIFSL